MRLTVVFVLSTLLSFSQDINGFVFDANTNEPLHGVNVFAKNTNEGTTTDNKGAFKLKTRKRVELNDTLYFSYVGFKTNKKTLSELNSKEFVVYLANNVKNLTEAIVTSDKILEPYLQFSRQAPLKEGVYSFGAALANNKIYVIAGDASILTDEAAKAYDAFDNLNFQQFLNKIRPDVSWQNYIGKLQVYDINSDSWKNLDLKFRKRAHHNLIYSDNKIYNLGGKNLARNRRFEFLDDKIEVFNVKNDTLKIDDTNPHQAVDFASCLFDGNIIVLGGSTRLYKNGNKDYSNKVHLYNIKSGYWYQLKDMPQAKETKGILIDNKIYLIGGFNKEPLNAIESFDLVDETWNAEGQLFEGMDRHAIACNKHIVYIFENGKMITYNTNTGLLNEYLIELELKSSKLFYLNDKLYILGGYWVENFSISPSTDVFSIDIREFTKTRINKTKTVTSEIKN